MQLNKKLNVVVVCQDDKYLKSIEYRLSEALAEKANITYISEQDSLKKYNAQPKDIDILLIDEISYKEVISRQNCKNVYLLIEDERIADIHEKEGNNNVIYKYSSIRSIIDKIDSKLLKDRQNTGKMSTKIVSVYSPAGGCGKTTISLGLAMQLGIKGYKVLYISTEAIQDYQEILDEHDCMPEQIGYLCNNQLERAAEEMLKYVKRSEFEYFPAFKRMAPAYGVKTEHLLKIASYIKNKNIYDYIVVELSCEVEEQKLNFIYQSEGVVLVMKQDEMIVRKLEKFLSNIVEWKGQSVIVCNFYDEMKMDYLTQNKSKLRYVVCEHIENMDSKPRLSKLAADHILEKTAVAIL